MENKKKYSSSRRLVAGIAIAASAFTSINAISIVNTELVSQAHAEEISTTVITDAWTADFDGNRLPHKLEEGQEAWTLNFNFDIPENVKGGDTITFEINGENNNNFSSRYVLSTGSKAAIRKTTNKDVVIGIAEVTRADQITVTFHDAVNRENSKEYYKGAYNVSVPFIKPLKSSSDKLYYRWYTQDKSKDNQTEPPTFNDTTLIISQGNKRIPFVNYHNYLPGGKYIHIVPTKTSQEDVAEEIYGGNIIRRAYVHSPVVDGDAGLVRFEYQGLISHFASQPKVRDIGYSFNVPPGTKFVYDDGSLHDVPFAHVEYRGYQEKETRASKYVDWGEGQSYENNIRIANSDHHYLYKKSNDVVVTRKGDKISVVFKNVPANMAADVGVQYGKTVVPYSGGSYSLDVNISDILPESAGHGVFEKASCYPDVCIDDDTSKDQFKYPAVGGAADPSSIKRSGNLEVFATNTSGSVNNGSKGAVDINAGENIYELRVTNTSNVDLVYPEVTKPDGTKEILKGQRVTRGSTETFKIKYDAGDTSAIDNQKWSINFFDLSLSDEISVKSPAAAKEVQSEKYRGTYKNTNVPNANSPVYSDISFTPDKNANPLFSLIGTTNEDISKNTSKKVKDADGNEWNISVNYKTGRVTATAPSNVKTGAKITVPVYIVYEDGSSNIARATFISSIQSESNPAKYDNMTVKPGETITNPQLNKTVEGATYSIVSGENATIDKNTGDVKFTVPKNTKKGDSFPIKIEVKYSDGSTSIEEFTFTVTTDFAAENNPSYPRQSIERDQTKTIAVNNDASSTLPEGTQFEIDSSWKSPEGTDININRSTGEITIKTTNKTPRGDINIPVVIKYADGTGPDKANASINVTTMADKHNPSGKDISVKINDKPSADDSIDNSGLPKGTTYEWKTSPDTSTTGKKSGTVIVHYPDESSDSVKVNITVTNQAGDYNPGYTPKDVRPGNKVSLNQDKEKTLPKGTIFEVEDFPSGWDVDINNDTGNIVATPPRSTPEGPQDIRVKISYPDGTSSIVAVPVNVLKPMSEEEKNNPNYEQTEVRPGNKATSKQLDEDLPKGTNFEIKDAPENWEITIDSKTGDIEAIPPRGNSPIDQEITVNVTYPDGSQKEVESIIKVLEPMSNENEPQVQDIKVDLNVDPDIEYDIVINNNDLPEGTKYEWEKKPDITKSGENNSTVKVTYPDGSSDIVDVVVTVESDADRQNPGYEEATTRVGNEVKITQNGDSEIPDGTKFVIKESPDEWKVEIDETTGDITVTPPRDMDVPITDTIVVEVTYPDTSKEEIISSIKVIQSMADEFRPIGKDIRTEISDLPDASVGINNKGRLPEGTSYEWSKEPDVTTKGDKSAIISINYPDDSSETVEITVTVLPEVKQSDKNDPVYDAVVIKPGEKITSKPSQIENIPDETTFSIDDTSSIPDDWNINIDSDTGHITIISPDGVDTKETVDFDVLVNYPDGSVDVVPVHIELEVEDIKEEDYPTIPDYSSVDSPTITRNNSNISGENSVRKNNNSANDKTQTQNNDNIEKTGIEDSVGNKKDEDSISTKENGIKNNINKKDNKVSSKSSKNNSSSINKNDKIGYSQNPYSSTDISGKQGPMVDTGGHVQHDSLLVRLLSIFR